jgi:hypothetical protein
MAGLLDILGGLLGGNQAGMQNMQGGDMSAMSPGDIQGLLAQRRQQGLIQGLLQAGQPSPYKKNFGQVLGEGLMGAQNATRGLEDSVLAARIKNMTPDWGETKDAFGNPIAFNKNDPSKTMPIGGTQVNAKPVSEFQQYAMDTAKQNKLDSQTERYSKTLESTGLSDLTAAAERANQAVAGDGDIAGYGEMVGALPDWMVSGKGVDTRQEIANLQNAILKARSGGAVTPSEANRFMSELGAGFGRGDSNLRKGIANITASLQEKINNSRAGFSPEAVNQYEDRGGNVTKDRLSKFLPTANGQMQTKSGIKYKVVQ